MSVPIFILPDPMTVTRRVLSEDMYNPIVTAVSTPFVGRVYPAREGDTAGAADASPRTTLKPHILWYKPVALASPIFAGDRFTTADGVNWEALTPAHGKRAGMTVLVYEVRCQKVTRLYPISAQLQEIGGAVVGNMSIAAWQSGQSELGRGSYQDLAAEAPIEAYTALRVANRQLAFGGKAYRINNVTLSSDQPYVRLTLRGAS